MIVVNLRKILPFGPTTDQYSKVVIYFKTLLVNIFCLNLCLAFTWKQTLNWLEPLQMQMDNILVYSFDKFYSYRILLHNLRYSYRILIMFTPVIILLNRNFNFSVQFYFKDFYIVVYFEIITYIFFRSNITLSDISNLYCFHYINVYFYIKQYMCSFTLRFKLVNSY